MGICLDVVWPCERFWLVSKTVEKFLFPDNEVEAGKSNCRADGL